MHQQLKNSNMPQRSYKFTMVLRVLRTWATETQNPRRRPFSAALCLPMHRSSERLPVWLAAVSDGLLAGEQNIVESKWHKNKWVQSGNQSHCKYYWNKGFIIVKGRSLMKWRFGSGEMRGIGFNQSVMTSRRLQEPWQGSSVD